MDCRAPETRSFERLKEDFIFKPQRPRTRRALWQAMDQAAIELAQRVAGQPSNIEYFYDNAWRATPPPLNRPFPEWHRGLGTTYHEAGTRWMGDDPSQSVTDANGRFHYIQTAFACDQSLFPTVGSVNPALTGLALARRLAEHLA